MAMGIRRDRSNQLSLSMLNEPLSPLFYSAAAENGRPISRMKQLQATMRPTCAVAASPVTSRELNTRYVKDD